MSILDDELERWTAGRLADRGDVALANPRDPVHQAEIDVYAIRYSDRRIWRTVAECTTSKLNHNELFGIKGRAATYRADQTIAVTSRNVSQPQRDLARDASIDLYQVDDVTEAIGSLGPRGRAVVTTLRCASVVAQQAEPACASEQLARKSKKVYTRVMGSVLRPDAASRSRRLHRLHRANPQLAAHAAGRESLINIPFEASDCTDYMDYCYACCKQAYAYGKGTYTQTALLAQTMNRVYTVITLPECALDIASGSASEFTEDRQTNWYSAASDLVDGALWPMVAPFVYHFVFVLGGIIPHQCEEWVLEDIAKAMGGSPEDVENVIGWVNRLLRRITGVRIDFIDDLRIPALPARGLKLSPYFLKGVGIRYLSENGISLRGNVDEWTAKVADLEAQLLGDAAAQ